MVKKEKKSKNLIVAKLWTPILLVVLLLIFGIQYPTFLSANNIGNLLTQMTIMLIAAMGMSMILIMGSIDVSVGATLTFSGVISAMMVPVFGGFGIIFGILVGAAIGLSNGLIATLLRIPTFLSTIAMMLILNGVSVLLLKGSPLNIDCEAFMAVAKGHLIGNIPNTITIPIIVVIFTVLLLKKTGFGRSLYAIGNNEYVAQYSGINVIGTQILAFTIHGALVGLAGGLQASILEAACPYMGDTYTLSVIAIVVMGGISLSGGKGGPIGTVLGAILITVLISGLNFMGVTPEIRDVAMGILVIFGALTSSFGRPRNQTVK